MSSLPSHLSSSSSEFAGTAARPASRFDLPAVVVAAILWGTGGLAGSLLGRLGDLHPLAVATYRLAGGGLTILLVLALAGRLAGLRTGLRAAGFWPVLRRVLLVGLLTASYQACYFASVAATSVGVATLITLGAAPVLVLAVETVRSRRRPGVASMAAIALAVGGLALLLGVPGGAGRLLVGALLALVSASGFAGLTLLGRKPVAGLDAQGTIGLGFVAGAVMLAALAVPIVGLGFAPSAATVGLLLFFAWVPTALAYALFFTGLRGVPASSAAVVAVLEPVTAAVLGALVLGERLGAFGIAGAALLCAAAVVAARPAEKRLRSGRSR